MEYKHTQIGYAIIWVSAAAAVLVVIGAIVKPPPHREILLVVCILFLVTIPLFYKLTITIDNEGLRASFGVGLIHKEIPLAQIVGCESIRIRWWYGWGIHLTPYGWLYNVAGWDAVAITLRKGQKFAVGTDDPYGLVAAIRRSA